jgi:hypothetical protein
VSGFAESDSTKKSKRSPSGVRATDSYVARRRANTPATSSFAIGMITAVRASGAIGGSLRAVREIDQRSRPRASTR